jgi:hypothetical protein
VVTSGPDETPDRVRAALTMSASIPFPTKIWSKNRWSEPNNDNGPFRMPVGWRHFIRVDQNGQLQSA